MDVVGQETRSPAPDNGVGPPSVSSASDLSRPVGRIGARFRAFAPGWAAVLALSAWYTRNGAVSRDDAIYTAFGRLAARGYRPYDFHFIDRPPQLLHLYAFATRLFGVRFGPAILGAVAAVILVTATVLAAQACGLRRSLATIAGLVAGVTSIHPAFAGYVSNELLAAAPAALAVALALRLRPSIPLACGCGLLAGSGFALKQTALDGIVVVTLVFLTAKHVVAKRRVLLVAVAVVSAVIPTIPGIVSLGTKHWLWQLFGARLGKVATNQGATSLVTRASVGLQRTLTSFAPILFLAVVGVAVGLFARGKNRPWTIVASWFACSVVLVSSGGNFWPSNFVGALVPATVLASVAASKLRLRASMRSAIPTLAAGMSATVWSVGALGSFVTLNVPASITVDGVRVQTADWAAGVYVKNRTMPDERVLGLVHLGGLMLASERPPAQRHVFGDLWVAFSEDIPETTKDIQRNPPAFIVEDPRTTSWLGDDFERALHSLLRDHYIKREQFGGLRVWERVGHRRPVRSVIT